MAEPKKSALEFPCSFPLKVIGKNTGDFEPKMIEIIRRHIPELNDQAVSTRLSRDGKYLAVTATFTAQSQEQLDAVYSELSSHELVTMVL